MEMSRNLFIVSIVVIVAVSAFGISYNISHSTARPGSAPSVDQLTLVITTNNQFNTSTGDQPAFYVLSNGTLQSSAVINLPVNQKVSLTIINYDDGSAFPLGPPGAGSRGDVYYNVSGTVGNVINVVNNTNVNSSQLNGSISVSGGKTVGSIALNDVAHTFTISGLNINIPIPPSSIVHTTLLVHGSGTYHWQCQAPCGSGSDGWSGAMATSGWMTGTVVVS